MQETRVAEDWQDLPKIVAENCQDLQKSDKIFANGQDLSKNKVCPMARFDLAMDKICQKWQDVSQVTKVHAECHAWMF